MSSHSPKEIDRRAFLDPLLVHAVGQIRHFRVENAIDKERIDHVWITLDIGLQPWVTVSINTRSLRNLDAGFDSRIRLGLLRGKWETLPPQGWEKWNLFNYLAYETRHNIFYEHRERNALEEILRDFSEEALLMEVWGAPYWNQGPGIHQIHSRRASCAVPLDIVDLDGALRFYFEKEREWVMVLLKFCEQL